MNFSNKDYLDFQLALSYYCYLKIRDILLKSMCDIDSSDIETIVDNSISNFLGDTDD